MQKKTIGEIIEHDVRKKQISITQFADMIHCKRNNVYNIFERCNIDIQLLGRISTVLGHNYFQDLADDPELLIPQEESEETLRNRKAVNQFLNVINNITQKINIKAAVILSKNEELVEGLKAPDFNIAPYSINLSIGEYFKDRLNGMDFGNAMVFDKYTSPSGTEFYIVTIQSTGAQFVDIKLDFKTEDEWEELLRFVLDTILSGGYFPRNIYEIHSLLKDY